MKFTKEEINLCKQIAEKYIKPMEYGDWWNDGKKVTLLFSIENWVMSKNIIKEEMFPLWTIFDCLKYLEIECVPLKMQIRDDSYARLRGWKWRVFWGNPNVEEGKPWGGSINASTLLEACLKAVLAVLEEGE